MGARVSSYKVSVTTTGVSIAPPSGDPVRAYDVVVVPDAGVSVLIGTEGEENFLVPSSGMSLGDVHRYSSEECWDLDKIFLKADPTAGDVSILISEIKDGN